MATRSKPPDPRKPGPKPKDPRQVTDDTDNQRLIQELELRQIELEMQNDELLRVHQDLEESWRKVDYLVLERTSELSQTMATLTSEVRQRSQMELELGQAKDRNQWLRDRNHWLANQLAAEEAFREEWTERTCNGGRLAGSGPAVTELCARIEQVACLELPVLLEGEPGSGRGTAAWAIHRQSGRRTLVIQRCGPGVPAEQLERALLGAETAQPAQGQKRLPGRIELAHQGTLFLDEVGELPPQLQTCLLRVYQTQSVSVPGTSPVPAAVRIIASTSQDLEQEAGRGRFRPDLLRVLGEHRIAVPPLRQRREDIPDMVRDFILRFNLQFGREVREVPSAVLEALATYAWPGNLRELEQVIERAVMVSPGPALRLPGPF